LRLILLVCCLLAACTSQRNSTADKEPVQTVVSLHFQRTDLDTLTLSARSQTIDFYQGNGFKMVWVDSTGLKSSADSMIYYINESANLGLIASDYHAHKLSGLARAPFSREQAVQLDAYLTDAFFSLAHDLILGRVDLKSFVRFRYDTLVIESVTVAMQQALSSGNVGTALNGFQPRGISYITLKDTLAAILKTPGVDSIGIKRKNQLVANLERLRQNRIRPDRYLSVNVPAFGLKVFENDTVVFESKVIVGKKETPTPNINSVIRSFIIYPYWHVPRSILDEILPSIQADTTYIAKHNYEVLDKNGDIVSLTWADWKNYDHTNFPYVLRQREGSENTMGVIKFVFSNRYGVYLHDTNARRLFSKKNRALSHGCVRVHKAVDLARYLAKDDDTYVSPADLDEYLLVQRKMVVNVVRPLPVYLDYFTVRIEDGKVIFYDDLYGWDALLLKALQEESEASVL
jgi:L,D-transpeptidase YcbB